MVFWHHRYQIELFLRRPAAKHKQQKSLVVKQLTASIIHFSHGLLHKRGIIMSNIESCFFVEWEGSNACLLSASVISQHFGSRLAFICCNDSLCSASSQLVVQICSGGCGFSGSHPPLQPLPFCLFLLCSFTFLYFYLNLSIFLGFCTCQEMGSHLL